MHIWKLNWWWASAGLTIIAAALALAPLQAMAQVQEETDPASENEAISDLGFQSWIAALRSEALDRGISRTTLDAALHDIAPVRRAVELDRGQAEYTQTFWSYLRRTVTEERIARGRALLEKYRGLLDDIYAKYGVPPRYLIALWGLETNFGDNKGSFQVINVLVTLAYDHRRSDFFRTQLLDALRIIDEGHITPERMKGSWAGAMGHMQFMPSTFLKYAVDYSDNGRKDIWNDLPDAFSSAANYLSKVGWRRGELWGREVLIPKNFDLMLATPSTKKTLKEWSALGVRRAYDRPLPQSDIEGSIILPQGHDGPAFMIYTNFRVILDWNRSTNYALAVGYLADRIADLPQIVNGRDADHEPLQRGDIEEMQQLLNHLGFAAGPEDGYPGPNTRSAIRDFQKSFSLPPDGYPTLSLLERLRQQRAKAILH